MGRERVLETDGAGNDVLRAVGSALLGCRRASARRLEFVRQALPPAIRVGQASWPVTTLSTLRWLFTQAWLLFVPLPFTNVDMVLGEIPNDESYSTTKWRQNILPGHFRHSANWPPLQFYGHAAQLLFSPIVTYLEDIPLKGTSPTVKTQVIGRPLDPA
jgi:hypothetical protein